MECASSVHLWNDKYLPVACWIKWAANIFYRLSRISKAIRVYVCSWLIPNRRKPYAIIAESAITGRSFILLVVRRQWETPNKGKFFSNWAFHSRKIFHFLDRHQLLMHQIQSWSAVTHTDDMIYLRMALMSALLREPQLVGQRHLPN